MLKDHCEYLILSQWHVTQKNKVTREQCLALTSFYFHTFYGFGWYLHSELVPQDPVKHSDKCFKIMTHISLAAPLKH